MARLIETGSHVAIPLPGRVHGRQITRLCELIQLLIDENGGWGMIHLEIRGGEIYKASREISELFAPDRIRPTA